MRQLRGVCVGAGYFSDFHLDAWKRIENTELLAICDLDIAKANQAADTYAISQTFTDVKQMLDQVQPNFIDIITPPATHAEICQLAGERGIHVLCQKPLAPSYNEAELLVARAETDGIRLMVHENFRFQPWHREIKRLIETGAIGDRLHTLTFHSRMGDGWSADAYLGRQPYFRTMARLLVYETGVHFIDTFQYLAGPINEAYAILRRLNEEIVGEDCGLLLFRFENGAVGMWDANRYNESNNPNFRYTFGTFLVEGNAGTIRLYADGRLTIQKLGKAEQDHPYKHEDRGFGGDCVFNTLRHFAQALQNDAPFETSGRDYLRVLEIQEALYTSAEIRRPVSISA